MPGLDQAGLAQPSPPTKGCSPVQGPHPTLAGPVLLGLVRASSCLLCGSRGPWRSSLETPTDPQLARLGPWKAWRGAPPGV